MASSKKLYESLAEGLVNSREDITYSAYRRVVFSIAYRLAEDNPNFDSEKFYKACGLFMGVDL